MKPLVVRYYLLPTEIEAIVSGGNEGGGRSLRNVAGDIRAMRCPRKLRSLPRAQRSSVVRLPRHRRHRSEFALGYNSRLLFSRARLARR
jgi:hypothetical protein